MRDNDGNLTFHKLIKHLHGLTGLVLCRHNTIQHISLIYTLKQHYISRMIISQGTWFAIMRCLRATIRLGMIERI